MRTALLMGLIAALCILGGFGPAMADSTVFYLDGSRSDALNLGFGYAFVFYNDLNPPDIFIHVINGFANFISSGVTLGTNSGPVSGFSFFLSFEGFNSGFRQYGVFACVGFANQTCTVNGTRRGTLFL